MSNDGPGDCVRKFRRGKGFGDILIGARAERRDRPAHRIELCHDNHGRRGLNPSGRTHKLDPAHVVRSEIDQDGAEHLLPQADKAIETTMSDGHGVPKRLEVRANDLGYPVFFMKDQHRYFAVHVCLSRIRVSRQMRVARQ
jgi:hypothetical protein